MKVTRVRFERFKSLYDVTCDLDRFTVITGPNGAGKSNLVDALNFVGEVYADGLEFAVAKAGGYDSIAHRRSRRAKRGIALTVECSVSVGDVVRHGRRYGLARPNDFDGVDEELSLTYRHYFRLTTSSQAVLADFKVAEESIEVLDEKGRSLLRLTREEQSFDMTLNKRLIGARRFLEQVLDPYSDERYVKFLQERKISPIGLLIDRYFFSGLFGPVKEALAGIRVFQLSPYQCRSTGVASPNAVLERHGENLPGAANHLRSNDRRAWKFVERGMRSVLPELVSIEIAYTEDRRLALQFKERGVGRAWNTNEVSDGTVQALALLVALYDERNPLLVIEEPENSVHPWILRQYLDLCLAAEQKQIVMTSHSPVLLNYVAPASVRLMSIRDGKSEIQRLIEMDPESKDSVLSGELGLFEYYDSGALPEALPRGFNQPGIIGDGE